MAKTNKFHPTEGQRQALGKLWAFLDDDSLTVFILKGYAGTGKTTMMKMFISALAEDGRHLVLLASTGRAAKILSDLTNQEAKTIHSHLYSFTGFNQDLDKLANESETNDIQPLLLKFDLKIFNGENASDIFIIDESSMISDKPEVGSVQAKFGSGNLIKDLLSHNPTAKYIFVGDECQLPPVNGNFSPALNKQYLEDTYQLKADEFALTEIVRQKKGNDIVISAGKVRNLFANPPLVKWGRFPLKGYNNIKILPSVADMLGKYVQTIKKGGYASATLITASNKSCTELARLLRPVLGFNSESLQVGELLLITQNNLVSGLMNGDLVKVIQIGSREIRAGLSFIEVEVENIANGKRYSQFLVEDILNAFSQINISQEQLRELYIDYARRMKSKGYKSNSEAFKQGMLKDPYLNALRAVYGYALTCYKSQGGEWEKVYLDIPRYFAKEPKSTIYQWLYTAMTRAKDTLYVVDDFFLSNN